MTENANEVFQPVAPNEEELGSMITQQHTEIPYQRFAFLSGNVHVKMSLRLHEWITVAYETDTTATAERPYN